MSITSAAKDPTPPPLSPGARGVGLLRTYRSERSFDRFMRGALRCPSAPRPVGERAIYRTFSTSMTISALRCLLTYVLLPVVTPALGLAAGVGPAVGIPVALVALFFDYVGIRRFWLADHPRRYAMTAIYLAVMALVAALLALDLDHLVH